MSDKNLDQQAQSSPPLRIPRLNSLLIPSLATWSTAALPVTSSPMPTASPKTILISLFPSIISNKSRRQPSLQNGQKSRNTFEKRDESHQFQPEMTVKGKKMAFSRTMKRLRPNAATKRIGMKDSASKFLPSLRVNNSQGQPNETALIRTSTRDKVVEGQYFIYTGIPNEFATKLVLTLMGFVLALVLLCIFLMLIVCIYFKDKNEQLFSDEKIGPTKAKVDKAHSPYVITPEQKITQQLLAAQALTPIECSVDDIAQLLRYMALYGKFSEDDFYRTSRTVVRLVPRGKTKFDEDSRREIGADLKSEVKSVEINSLIADGSKHVSSPKKGRRFYEESPHEKTPHKLGHGKGTKQKLNKSIGEKKSEKGWETNKKNEHMKKSNHDLIHLPSRPRPHSKSPAEKVIRMQKEDGKKRSKKRRSEKR